MATILRDDQFIGAPTSGPTGPKQSATTQQSALKQVPMDRFQSIYEGAKNQYGETGARIVLGRVLGNAGYDVNAAFAALGQGTTSTQPTQSATTSTTSTAPRTTLTDADFIGAPATPTQSFRRTTSTTPATTTSTASTPVATSTVTTTPTSTTLGSSGKKAVPADRFKSVYDSAVKKYGETGARIVLERVLGNAGYDVEGAFSAMLQPPVQPQAEQTASTFKSDRIPELNEFKAEIEKRADRDSDINKQIMDQQMQFAQVAEQTGNAALLAIEENNKQRVEEMNNAYTQVFNTIENLNKLANDLFDLQNVQAVKTRANQLAQQGILTSEQAAAAGGFIISQYAANAELARGQIMLESQARMANAIKDRANALESIAKDVNLSEAQKIAQSNTIQAMYNNILMQQQNIMQDANRYIDASVDTLYNKEIELALAEKVPFIEQEIKNQLNDLQMKELDMDQNKRLLYIMDAVNAISPTLAPFAAEVVADRINTNRFMNVPIASLIANVAADAQALLKSEANAARRGVGGSSGGTVSTPSTGTETGTSTSSTGTGTSEGAAVTPESVLEELNNMGDKSGKVTRQQVIDASKVAMSQITDYLSKGMLLDKFYKEIGRLFSR